MSRFAFLLALPAVMAAQSPDPAAHFESRVRPLLAAHCFVCHGPQLQTSGINLSTAEGVRAVVEPGDPDGSRLIRAVRYDGKIKMPPPGKLDARQIADLTTWVKMGAPWPKLETARRPNFWWMEPARGSAPPAVGAAGWVKNPIDNFILAKLESKGIDPAPGAGKAALLRRATFDLTGLPPAPQEISEFLADEAPDAFARVVDRLLASPRYGERWGRHWLDVARYADSTGADEDHRYPHAWRYRDYVIDAFNRDLPYDQFVREQIAGDLLPAQTPGEVNTRGVVATGFLALGPKLIAEQDKPKMVYDTIDEQIDVTGRAFLGLTIACARCHDHKFDPIPTKDYYSLASIFASTRNYRKVEGTVSQMYMAPLVPQDIYKRYEKHRKQAEAKKKQIDEMVEAEAARYAARLRPRLADYMLATREPDRLHPDLDPAVLEKWIAYLKPDDDVRPHLDRWQQATPENAAQTAAEYQKQLEKTAAQWAEELATWNQKVEASLRSVMTPPEKPKFDAGKDRFFHEVSFAKGPFALPEKEPEKVYSPEAREQIAGLRLEWEELKKATPPEPPMACAVAEGESVAQRVFIRGNVGSPGEAAPKRFPAVLAGENQAPITEGSGRLELARWLSGGENPLTARVMVNRIWQWHFGEGLMRTPSNWGTLGERPTHQELLDWLTRYFVEHGWSVKAMHRLILASSAYQMSSEVSREKLEKDPANRLWSRFNRRRLDVEEIRDGMLAIEGALDVTVGGTLQSGTGTDGENAAGRMSLNPEKNRRRTVYLPLRRSNLPSLLNLFDFGDATTTGEGRSRTNVAPQALFMMNSAFVADRAEALAKSPPDVEGAYLRLLGRPASAEELAEARDYVDRAGWSSFFRVLLASNEFLYVD